MISVVVPIYNVEKYLHKCIDSIINQTYKDLEIILINDGSLDNSRAICDEYAEQDKRVVVIHQTNSGLSSARNAGLKFANGDLITFIDSDDYISENCFLELVRAIEKNNADIAMCDCIQINENGKVLSEDLFGEDKVYKGSEIVETFVLPLKTAVWNKLFKKEVIGKNRFPDGYIHGEDLVFLTTLLKRDTKLATTCKGEYFYVKHSNSITTAKQFSERIFDEVYCKDTAYTNLIKYFPEYSNDALIWRLKARMNIVRKVIKHKKENQYKNIIPKYVKWIDNNYSKCKNKLNKQEKVEFVLLRKFPSFYKQIIGVVEFIKSKLKNN